MANIIELKSKRNRKPSIKPGQKGKLIQFPQPETKGMTYAFEFQLSNLTADEFSALHMWGEFEESFCLEGKVSLLCWTKESNGFRVFLIQEHSIACCWMLIVSEEQASLAIPEITSLIFEANGYVPLSSL